MLADDTLEVKLSASFRLADWFCALPAVAKTTLCGLVWLILAVYVRAVLNAGPNELGLKHYLPIGLHAALSLLLLLAVLPARQNILFLVLARSLGSLPDNLRSRIYEFWHARRTAALRHLLEQDLRAHSAKKLSEFIMGLEQTKMLRYLDLPELRP